MASDVPLHNSPLSPPDFPDCPTYCKEMFRIEELFRGETDRAAETLIDTGAPPSGAPAWAMYFLILRLMSAVSFLHECNCKDAQGYPLAMLRRTDSKCVFFELLCGLWKKCRRDHFLKASAFSAYHGLPLFGVVPPERNG